VRIFIFRLAMSTIRANVQLRIARVLFADAAPRNFGDAACLHTGDSLIQRVIVTLHDIVN
jgi:hypothetical protein